MACAARRAASWRPPRYPASRPRSTGCSKGFVRDPEFERIVENDLRDGRHVNPARNPGWFTTAYFHLPDDLAVPRCAPPASRSATLVAIEGIGAWLPDVDEWLDDPERRAVLLRTIARVETEPACSAPARTCSPSA